MGRISKQINLPKRILILCEGESEQIYLKGLKKDISSNYNLQNIEIVMHQPNDFTPLGIVKEAKKKIIEAKKDRYPYFSVWVVFDKDDHKKIDEAFNLAYNSSNSIRITFSNICFEYWILLHFDKKNRYFRNSAEIISFIEQNYKFNYTKTMNIYESLKNKIDLALSNSEWLHKQNKFDIDNKVKLYNLNAYTDFDKLYLYIKNLKKKNKPCVQHAVIKPPLPGASRLCPYFFPQPIPK